MGDEREGLDYIYVGCYDRRIRKRFDYNYKEPDRDNKMSPLVCVKHCQPIERSKVFGITRGDMCMCGILYRKWHFPYTFDTLERYKENNTECNIDCFGNRGEKCGGSSTYSMYKILTDTSSPVPTSNPTTAYAQGITTDDLNTTSSPIKNGRTTEHGIKNSIVAGVSVGVALFLILVILLVLIRKRSKKNVSRTLQSSYNTDESVRYDNVPQSIQGAYSPYATLTVSTVSNDCSTYDDLMPKEVTYENTETMATNYVELAKNTEHKSRKKKRRKR
ncbi:uncharacterized protein LOC127707517 [Mytilus californianus]|uniref:uncharacterized protein LOC127707517 n=1 Tax=Mytilus californianus TaxID=6549 RepID=UPI0022478BD9|nr:uncharacterized protein LOC127707517 [Mytilus californianus]